MYSAVNFIDVKYSSFLGTRKRLEHNLSKLNKKLREQISDLN